MLPALLLAFSVLACASSSITWLQPQRSAIIALDTPGYPFWLMDKANAPALYRDAEKYYWETHSLSAVLLNLSMTADNKTLLVNRQAILPLEDYNIPPRITAYQVPANITEGKVRSLAELGLLRGDWEQLTLSYRFLELDYDRLAWADPASGPYQNNVPTMRFRIMGIGAHSRNDVPDAQRQKVLHVTLTDQNHGSSNDAKRSYVITNIEIKSFKDSYGRFYRGPAVVEEKECALRSWRCPDKGLYEVGAPYYRFIWRKRFDEFGRIGSLRHAVVWKMSVLKEFWEDAGPAMLMSFGILMALAILGMIAVRAWKGWGKSRERMVRGLAEDDSLHGENVGKKYTDEDKEQHWEAPPPTLADAHSRIEEVRPLIDIASDDEEATR